MKNILVLFICLISFGAKAQDVIRFSKFSAFGFPGAVFGGVQIQDSFYIATGLAFDSINPNYDHILWIKFNMQGDVVQAKTIPDTYGYQAWYRSYTDESENLITFGRVFPQDSGDIFLIKMDKNGEVLYNNKYKSADYYMNPNPPNITIRQVVDVLPTGNKGFIFLSNEGITTNEFTSFMIDSLENRLWNKVYNASQYELPYCMAKDKNGGYLLGGVKHNSQFNYMRSHIVKIDDNGNKIWEYISPTNQGAIQSMVQNNDGELIIAAEDYDSIPVGGSGVHPEYIPQIIKLDTSRQVVWLTQLPAYYPFQYPGTTKIMDNNDGTYSGCGISPGLIDLDSSIYAHLFRITEEGELLWHRWYRYLPIKYDADHQFRDFQRTADGGYILCGYGIDFSTPGVFEGASQRAWIVKVDSFGCLVEDCQLVSTEEPTEAYHKPFTFYPNPASEVLYLHGSKYAHKGSDYSLHLFNNQGVEVISVTHIDPEITAIMPIHYLPVGVYRTHIYHHRQLVQSEIIIIQH